MTAMLVIGIVGAAGVAHAGDSAQAEALIRQGVELRQQGRDAPALPLFQKAYDLVATPRTAGQLGCGEMALGYWLDAEQHLGEALAATDDPWVSKNLKTLKDALVRVRGNLGEIAVTGAPAGAKVTVNRRAVGVLPLATPVRVAKGKVDIEVSAPGFVAMTRSLQVEGGASLHLAAELVRVPVAGAVGAPASTASPATPAPQRSGGTTGGTAVSSPPVAALPSRLPGPASSGPGDADEGGGGSVRRKIGWGLGVTAGAVLVGSVVETFVWQRKRNQFNTTTGCFEDAGMRGAPGCSSLFDSAHQAEVITLIGYAAAAVLAGGAAALLLTGDAPEPRRSGGAGVASNVACAPGAGASLLSCRFTF
jgi:hypothetical protein